MGSTSSDPDYDGGFQFGEDLGNLIYYVTDGTLPDWLPQNSAVTSISK